MAEEISEAIKKLSRFDGKRYYQGTETEIKDSTSTLYPNEEIQKKYSFAEIEYTFPEEGKSLEPISNEQIKFSFQKGGGFLRGMTLAGDYRLSHRNQASIEFQMEQGKGGGRPPLSEEQAAVLFEVNALNSAEAIDKIFKPLSKEWRTPGNLELEVYREFNPKDFANSLSQEAVTANIALAKELGEELERATKDAIKTDRHNNCSLEEAASFAKKVGEFAELTMKKLKSTPEKDRAGNEVDESSPEHVLEKLKYVSEVVEKGCKSAALCREGKYAEQLQDQVQEVETSVGR